MKKSILPFGLAAVLAATPAMAQDFTITPVWESLITSESKVIPIIKQNEPTAGEAWDGTDVYESFGGLKRYDDERLILAVRENGIDETDPNHDAELAALYPDRSLIFLNPGDGSYMGIALEVGFEPVTLSDEFLAAGGSTLDYYFAFGVAEDGVIFTNYKNTVVRYAPDGNGGFGAPTIAYEYPDDGTDTWTAWRWETFKVTGSGADTTIMVGGKTWRTNQWSYYLTTTDGVNFEASPTSAGFRGGHSSPFLDPEFGDSLLVIGGNYPGGASGFGTDIRRYFAGIEGQEWITDELFEFSAPSIDSEAQNFLDSYIGWFLSGFDAANGLPYFVVYSTPSWDTKDPGTAGSLGFGDNPLDTPYLPGWLALHDIVTGEYIEGSAHMLDVTEGDQIDGDTDLDTRPIARWHGTLGDVNLYIPETAAEGGAELLWHSGTYGIGRYTIGNTGVNEWSLY